MKCPVTAAPTRGALSSGARWRSVPAVLFDLDGTLHDRETGLQRFARAHADALCADPSLREAFCTQFLLLDDNGKVWKDRVYEQLREEFGSSAWPTTDRLVQTYLRDFPLMAVETRGASNLLRLLKRHGVQTAVITNGRSDLQRSIINALGFDTLVEAVVISEEVGFRKPHEEIFHIALRALACTPADAVMIGDDPVADIEGARSVGIHPIAFRCAAGAALATPDLQSAGIEMLARLGGPPNNSLERSLER